MKIDDLLKRVDQLISIGDETLKTTHTYHSDMFGSQTFVNTDSGISFRAAALNFIKNIYGEENPYYKEFDEHSKGYDPDDIKNGISILRAIKNEISEGWLVSFKELVSAEIFTDFLEMGEYLLEQKYKDPAAVIFGSVLEEKLRQLAIKNGIVLEIERDGKIINIKADSINAELAKMSVYNKLDQKQITALLDLRNKAAHGKYDDYNLEQVRIMQSGVLEFIARN